MDRFSLFQEYRLIERSESEVNGIWKSGHILLFFLTFVFGSFCTFSFHILMYLFDDKCVLFPKLQSLVSNRQDAVYEFLLDNKDAGDKLPVDFLSSHWMEKSACYLPTYVPLLSGIFGLIWTTMFLMCSAGSRAQTSLQKPWRVLPPVFVFSLAMGGLSVYSSVVTQYGLHELCLKLAEVTGGTTCTYTVNVATLAYERRIRGVYQAIRLTVTSAWLHTICWILSALLALARVILAVDFQLVRVSVDIIGDIDKMLERHETLIHTVSPEIWFNDDVSETSIEVPIYPENKVHFTDAETLTAAEDLPKLGETGVLYVSKAVEEKSNMALVSSESHKLARQKAAENVSKDYRFIVNILYDLLLSIDIPLSESTTSDSEELLSDSVILPIARQLGQEKILPYKTHYQIPAQQKSDDQLISPEESEEIAQEIIKYLYERLYEQLHEFETNFKASTSKRQSLPYESHLNITDEMREILESKRRHQMNKETNTDYTNSDEANKVVKKSNLKHASVQTDKKRKRTSVSTKVTITEPEDRGQSTETMQNIEKETEKPKNKEKQD